MIDPSIPVQNQSKMFSSEDKEKILWLHDATQPGGRIKVIVTLLKRRWFRRQYIVITIQEFPP
jgi:hypothetical protein